jgi:hypothetical protein
MAMLRQVAVLAPGSTLAMTFLLPLQFADPEVGLSWQRRGREPAGRLSSVSSRQLRCWHLPAKPALERPAACRRPRLPSASSRAEPMAFDRRTMRKNCSSRRRGGDDIPPGPSGLKS